MHKAQPVGLRLDPGEFTAPTFEYINKPLCRTVTATYRDQATHDITYHVI